MSTDDLPEESPSGTNGSTDAVTEFEDGTVGFPENSPLKSVVEMFQEHGLGKEVPYRTIINNIDHTELEIMQVIDELEDLLLVTEIRHDGNYFYKFEDTPLTRTFVNNLTDS